MRGRLPLLLLLAGCTSDLRAPSDYLVSADDETTGGAELDVDCSMLPLAAVDATFAGSPTVMGGDEDYTFELDGDVPPGLEIDADSGEITGIPTADGDFMFDLVVSDGADGMGMATCEVTVAPRLTVPLQIDNDDRCLTGDDSLLDVILDGTGDGTPIVCDAPGGKGNGRVPTGLSVGEDNCQIEGNLQETRYGTWVFIMRGTQSGADVFVPYCVTQDDLGDMFEIRVTYDDDQVDSTLDPFIGTFNPDADFALGDGDMVPFFEIEDADSCGDSSCFYGFSYRVNSNNFNDTNLMSLVTGDGLLRNEDDDPIGMRHALRRLEGSELEEDFATRPWVMNLDLDYCLSVDEPDCDGTDAIEDNAGLQYEFSVLMVPDQ